MPSKKTPPRKKPQQARAQQTVNAILEATIQVLEREGPEAATTTRIAEVAGVSVGTLYQYFSHRDAIFDGLQEREFTKALAMTQEILSEGNQLMEGLRTTKADRLQSFDMRVIGIIRHFLSATGSVRRKNVDAAAFIAFQCVRAVMLARLLEPSPGLNDAAMVEELVDLLMRYLVEEDVESGTVAKPRTEKSAQKNV